MVDQYTPNLLCKYVVTLSRLDHMANVYAFTSNSTNPIKTNFGMMVDHYK